EVNVRSVAENDGDLRKPVPGKGPSLGDSGDARHGGFDGIGDLLFHFLRGEPLSHRVDLDLHVGDVGNGVDAKITKRHRTRGGHTQGKQDHDGGSANGKREQAFKHGKTTATRSRGAGAQFSSYFDFSSSDFRVNAFLTTTG